ncbi:MAG: hypothetical protein IJ504_06320 [Bacteroidales bacterium]|nr:hypothetical protein [Bacteroidales bacterium]
MHTTETDLPLSQDTFS